MKVDIYINIHIHIYNYITNAIYVKKVLVLLQKSPKEKLSLMEYPYE